MSSSTSLKNIALIGSGGIGTTILRALVETKKTNVIVLTRASSNPKTLPPDLSAVPIIRVDYADVSAVAAILKSHDIEIVISALSNTPAFQAQFALADAAKASGTVKLFVPSEWGIPTEGAKQRGPDNMFALKDAVALHLKAIGLPYTRFWTGFFIEYLLWIFGSNTAKKSINVLGRGEEVAFSTTSEEDIGGFVAHVLTTLPSSSPLLLNKGLRLQGQRLTASDLARIHQLPVLFIPAGGEIPAKTAEDAEFKKMLQIEIEAGRASTGWDRPNDIEIGDAGEANKLWEGHVWKAVENCQSKYD